MRRWLGWLLVLLAVAGCARTADAPAARPALWRATDGDTTIWLFGTIHLLPPDVRWNAGPVAKAIAQSDTLITEIPEADPAAQAAAFLKLARADGLPALAERVPPGERSALAAVVAAAGVPVATLDRMTTWGAALALTSGAARGLGATREAAPEAALAAAFAGKHEAAFETFAGQLGIFAALPEAEQRQLLSAAVASARNAKGEYGRLLRAWRTGDTAAIADTFDRAFRGAPALPEALVTARNRAWADELKRRAALPGTLFVAIGAGHLVGGDALPALLSARGFRVARVQ